MTPSELRESQAVARRVVTVYTRLFLSEYLWAKRRGEHVRLGEWTEDRLEQLRAVVKVERRLARQKVPQLSVVAQEG